MERHQASGNIVLTHDDQGHRVIQRRAPMSTTIETLDAEEVTIQTSDILRDHGFEIFGREFGAVNTDRGVDCSFNNGVFVFRHRDSSTQTWVLGSDPFQFFDVPKGYGPRQRFRPDVRLQCTVDDNLNLMCKGVSMVTDNDGDLLSKDNLWTILPDHDEVLQSFRQFIESLLD